MACTCRAASSGACLCEFTSVESVAGNTLVDALTPVVDCVRDLYTQLGLRAYEVSLVWTRWTGQERGVGNEYVVWVERLLPTPKLSDLSALTLELKEIGTNEQGALTVTELSGRFSEDLLMGRGGPLPLGEEIPPDTNFFWEVSLPVSAGAIRRRFTPASAPSRRPGSFDWEVRLMQQDSARLRDGRLL
jgi:hypothetical protein